MISADGDQISETLLGAPLPISARHLLHSGYWIYFQGQTDRLFYSYHRETFFLLICRTILVIFWRDNYCAESLRRTYWLVHFPFSRLFESECFNV